MLNNKVKIIPGVLLTAILCVCLSGCSGDISGNSPDESFELSASVPVQGNSWIVDNPTQSHQIVNKEGISNWNDENSRIRTYFRLARRGEINVAIRAKVDAKSSKIKFTFGSDTREIKISNISYDTIQIGTFKVDEPGYQWLEMQGVNKNGSSYAEVTDILIGGEATQGAVHYVKDDFYWGRRGPSVHLGYQIPEEDKKVVWFYNEVTVPENNDVQGSYFMANGFGEGYFGMQVNSPTERRVLFSVWSPYKTDNPQDIPQDMRIKLLKKSNDVHTGEFGNEGSGGQSYLKYLWKAGVTYRFLLKGEPAGNNSTDYTAYFYAPEVGRWKLIASFRRPQTNTYLTHLHSFLENFIPDMGASTRKVLFSNQWVCNENGVWTELNRARFTADATARKEARLDYNGGSENGYFFLRNCGFFNEQSTIDEIFTRDNGNKKPSVDFSLLP